MNGLFIGHRNCPNITIEQIKEAMLVAYNNYNIKNYLNGGMGRFDMLSAQAIFELKRILPDNKCYLIAPFPNFRVKHPEYYDKVILPEEIKSSNSTSAILKRNLYMVRHSSYSICYVEHQYGGAYTTYINAKMYKHTIVNLAVEY